MSVDRQERLRPAGAHHAVVLPRLTGHAIHAFLRNPLAAFFTLAFPLAFLVIVSTIIGDQTTGDGVAVTQFLVAPFAVFGVAQASFTLVATDTAVLRERGVLLRLRATPVSPRTVLAARIGASAVVAGLGVVVLTAVGVAAYDVDLVGNKVPAALVTLLFGIACGTALGLALAASIRTVTATQALAQGLLIPLAFISDVFIVGADLPRPLAWLGSALPLKHLAQAMEATFEPGPGAGFSPGHLAILAAWTVAGALIARRRFGWEPRERAATRPAAVTVTRPVRESLSPPRPAGRASSLGMLRGQISYALLGLRRDPLSVFFAIVFPALLLALFPSVFGDARVHGLTMAQYLFAGLAAYTVAVTAFVDMTEGVVGARSAGVLKRLLGTPLPFRWYVAGRVCAALVVGALGVAVLAGLGTGFLGVRFSPGRLPALIVAVLLGSLCFSALGLAVAALVPGARSLVAVTLGTLLPLCFLSEIFVVGDRPLPGTITTVADVFPLWHLLQALLEATRPGAGGAGFAWAHLAVVTAWAALGLTVARWRRARLT
ncbi:ABC transporter permease [Actinoplanes sp. LDG1-06]|uniref:Transport permease protein n=1 Tax=Paractinoplanes ovalisporus TaxID=2810368 RepID=A0ABS2AAH8_9ACTN|nr:ABC transporter permease [Actinoplanes ovalisporus]MBM2616358.1 ABC transporter permease [Actinoplanes ovalisporus]